MSLSPCSSECMDVHRVLLLHVPHPSPHFLQLGNTFRRHPRHVLGKDSFYTTQYSQFPLLSAASPAWQPMQQKDFWHGAFLLPALRSPVCKLGGEEGLHPHLHGEKTGTMKSMATVPPPSASGHRQCGPPGAAVGAASGLWDGIKVN